MPGSGHIISMVEMANILLARDHRLAVTMIAIKLYPWISKLMNISNHFLHSLVIPATETIHPYTIYVLPALPAIPNNGNCFFLEIVLESYKPHVKQALISFLTTSTNHLVGFVLDMFCSTMVDIANEFEVPSYAYCTSGAGFFFFFLVYILNNFTHRIIVVMK